MALMFDPSTGDISYQGKVVGRHEFENGRSRVSLNITYECGPGEEWVVPLSWFAYGLALLPQNQVRHVTPELEIETPESEIAQEFPVAQTLLEKLVKRDGYIWAFHKADVDHWPSLLHGHDYDKCLKLDALTGDIYDTGTRQLCKTLSRKELLRVQKELRRSADFKAKLEIGLGVTQAAIEGVDKPSSGPGAGGPSAD